ncbi:MAG: hypothetical protein IJI41_09495 [Anaerolineaceae bacterium]|nr:hypothetical protein [Anaerolineaceae bacterium]
MPVKNDNERIEMLITIVERGKGKKLVRFLKRHQVNFHLEFSGVGTATSEMLDVLGLNTKEKDVLLSMGTRKAVKSLTNAIDAGLWEISRSRGLMMQLSLSAVNNLISAALIQSADELPLTENEEKMINEFDHSLLLIAVKQGYTEIVMQSARKAGATGGTVIRSRMMGEEMFEENYGIRMDPEKEIIAILAPNSLRDAILDVINTEHGVRSPAQSMICALPVDKAFKI